MSMSMSIKIFSVAKIAELLRRRSRVTVQNREMIVEKEMFYTFTENR